MAETGRSANLGAGGGTGGSAPLSQPQDKSAIKPITIGFIGAGIVFVLPILLDTYVVPKSSDWAWFVVQTFAGNWSPPDSRPGPLSTYWFLFLAEIAIILNCGAFAFLVGVFNKVRKLEKERKMKLTQIFDERDSAIITLMLSSVPREQRGDAIKKLREVFSEVHKFWLKDLVPGGLEKEQAETIVNFLETAEFGPRF
jgi:hypothetical protein